MSETGEEESSSSSEHGFYDLHSLPGGASVDVGGGVYYLAKCVVHGSAVLHAVQGHFRFSHSTDIIFGKTGVPIMLDGDMLFQFLELTTMQQELVLAPSNSTLRGTWVPDLHQRPLSVNLVVGVLERLHCALN